MTVELSVLAGLSAGLSVSVIWLIGWSGNEDVNAVDVRSASPDAGKCMSAVSWLAAGVPSAITALFWR